MTEYESLRMMRKILDVVEGCGKKKLTDLGLYGDNAPIFPDGAGFGEEKSKKASD